MLFLTTFHNIEIHILRTYGLLRRNPDYNVDTLTAEIREMLDGAEGISGLQACMIWSSVKGALSPTTTG